MLTLSVSRAAELTAQKDAEWQVIRKKLGAPEIRLFPANANSLEELLSPLPTSPKEEAQKNFAHIASTRGPDEAASVAADAARCNAEMFRDILQNYNWALYELTPERLEAARAKMAPEAYADYRQRRQDDVESCGSSVQSWAKQMGEVFAVNGPLFEEQADGRLRLGQFTLTFAGDGYTARADSSGGTGVSVGAAPAQASGSPVKAPASVSGQAEAGGPAPSSLDGPADRSTTDLVGEAVDALAVAVADLAAQSAARLKSLGASAGGYTAAGLPEGRSAASGKGGTPAQFDVCV
jgi:hypothetical protein